jgi:hypothetical protein
MKGMVVRSWGRFFIMSMASCVLSSCSLETAIERLNPKTGFPIVSVADLSLTEGSSGNLQFTVSTSFDQEIVINYSSSSGSATEAADYTGLSGTLTIPAGTTLVNLPVSSLNDAWYEPNETFTLTLSTPANANMATTAKSVQITDDETMPTVAFQAATDSATEAAGTHNVVAVLSGPAQNPITVNYTIMGGAAAAGSAMAAGVDYVLTNGTITFASNTTTQNIAINVNDDTTSEPSEDLDLAISAPSGATLGAQTTHELTITDNDGLPTIQFAAATDTVVENVAGGTKSLAVVLSNPSSTNITVNYAVTGGSAAGAGTDYTLTSGTLTIAAGSTTGGVVVAITNDSIYEGTEDVIVTLSSPSANATVPAAQDDITLSITDNEAQPLVYFAGATSSGNEGTTPHTVAVSLSHASTADVTVNYTVTGGSAGGAGVDYTLAAGTLTFLGAAGGGSVSESLSIVIVNDSIYETTEDIEITLSAPVGATLSAPTIHTHSIIDNEAVPTVQFSAATSNAAENVTPHNVVVTLSGPAQMNLTVDYSVTGGSATGGGTDYTLAAGTITFAGATGGGSVSENIAIAIANDATAEGAETINLGISNPSSPAVLGGVVAHVHTINDDESPPEVTFDLASSNAAESVGTHNIQVNLTVPAAAQVTVNYAVTGGSAINNPTAGFDYTLASGTLTFAIGETTKQIPVAVVNDTTGEPAEDVVVTLSGVAGGSATLSTQDDHTFTINASDAPTIQYAAATSSVNENVAGGSVTIAVTLSNAASADVTVDYAVTGGSAINNPAAGFDYTLVAGTLTFSAGQTSRNITVGITDDAVYEGSEDVDLNLTNAVGTSAPTISGNTTHELTILDNEVQPTISVTASTASVAENVGAGGIVLSVTLTHATTQEVTASYATANGTATAGSDYTSNSGTITIAAMSTTGSATIAILDDVIVDGDETFSFTISSPVNATLHGTNVATTVTITENDTTAPFTWIGGGGNSNWSNTANWSTGVVPGGADTAIFDNNCVGANCNATINVAIDIGGIDMKSTYTGTITQGAVNVILNGGGLAIAGGTLSGSTNLFRVRLGTITLSGGTWTAGNQTIEVLESDWLATASVFVAGTSTVSIDVIFGSQSLSLGATPFNNVTFSGAEFGGGTTIVGVMNVNGNLSLADGGNSASSGYLISGQISVKGNVLATKRIVGSVQVDLTGTGAQTWTGGPNGAVPYLTINNPSVSPVTITGAVRLAGGMTYTAGNVDATASSFEFTENTYTNVMSINASGMTFNDVTFNPANSGSATALFNISNLSVDGDLVFNAGTTLASYIVNNSTITVKGDVTIATAKLQGGSTALTLTGSSSQTLTQAAGSVFMSGGVTINKSASAAVLGSHVALNTAGQDLNLTLGTINMAGYNLTINDALSTAAGTKIIKECGTLTNGSHSPALGTIIDGKEVSISVADDTETEGTSLGFIVTVTPQNCMSTTFDYATSNATAAEPGDYTALTTTSTNIPANTSSITINVSSIDDALHEASEYFTFTLSNLMAGVTAGDLVGNGNLTDDDAAAMPSISVNSPAAVTEGTNISFVVSLSGVSGQNVVFDWATADGTAQDTGTDPDDDYTAGSGTVTIAAGQTSVTLSAIATNDDLYTEAAQAFTVTLSNLANATAGTIVGTGTINDNDNNPVNVSVTVNEVIGGSPVAMDGTVEKSTTVAITPLVTDANGDLKRVTVQIWKQPSVTNVADYVGQPGFLDPGLVFTTTWVPTAAPFGFIPATYSLVAGDTYYIRVASIDERTFNLYAPAQHADKWTDTWIPFTVIERTLSINDPAAVTEGSNVSFVVSLSAASDHDVTFNYATSDGTAVEPGDYTAVTSTAATILAGQTSITLPAVTTIDDANYEPQETFTVAISSPNNAAISDSSGTATLNDNDPLAVVAAYSNGSNWNDYIKNDGADIYNATNTACAGTENGYDLCMNGGEMRKVVITGVTSCAGLTMTDNLAIFNWTCVVNGGTATFYTNGFQTGKGLKDLLATGNVNAWKGNYVTLAGSTTGTSTAAAWWSNAVVALPNNSSVTAARITLDATDDDGAGPGGGPDRAYADGTIFKLSFSRATSGYTLGVPKMSLVVLPGATLSYSGKTAADCRGGSWECILRYVPNYSWIEGDFLCDPTSGTRAQFAIDEIGNGGSFGLRLHRFTATTCQNGGVGVLSMKSSRWTYVTNTGSGNSGLHLGGVHYNYFSNVTSSNNTGTGITLHEQWGNFPNYNTFADIVTANNSYGGIQLNDASYNNFTNTTATGSWDWMRPGIEIRTGSNDNTFTNMTLSGNHGSGLSVWGGANNNSFSNVTAHSHNAHGVAAGGNNGTYTNITAYSNNVGFWISGNNNTVTNVTVKNNTNQGFIINEGQCCIDDNTVRGLISSKNGGAGLEILQGANTKIIDATLVQNGSLGLYINNNYDGLYENIRVSNNSSYGILFNNWSERNTFVNVLSSNNGQIGFYLADSSKNNSFSAMTFASNGTAGLLLRSGSQRNTISNIVSVNNNGNGIESANDAGANNRYTFSNTVVTNNGGAGVSLASHADYTKFAGVLMVGNNTGLDCSVSGGTDTGLVNSTCTTAGTDGSSSYTAGFLSTAVLRTGRSLASAFTGKVPAGDTANTSDTNGEASYPGTPSTFDWFTFDNGYRAWGVDGTNYSGGGRWTSGTGAIWDWSLKNTDTVIFNRSGDGSAANGAFTAGSACPGVVNGDVTTSDQNESGANTYLINAREITDPNMTGYDAADDNDGLCEANENCVYMPNFGFYQGHGSLGTCTYNANGGLTGITMYGYGSNGF